ncbi:MAG: hypothetical protein R3336_00490 [Phycisphaeraceae bacterium]|nr:hypothetical protein [Phycisphaeraceae bacterium]
MTRRGLIPALIATVALAGSALAIQPQTWEHTTEADFEPGESDAVVVTSLGDLALATDSNVLAEMPEEVSIIYDGAVIDDRLYLAGGPQARLLVREEGEIKTLVELPDQQIFALHVLDGRLLAAVSGEKSRLAVLEDGKLKTLLELPDARYIWDIATVDGGIAIATGTEGRVLHVPLKDGEAGEPTVLLDSETDNVLCLAAGPDNLLYAGTDKEGLVYRLDLTGENDPYIVYDANEPEIGALLVDGDVVYAGTADASQARPGRLQAAGTEETGRPQPAGSDSAEDGEGDGGEGDGEGDQPDVPNQPPAPDPVDEAPDADAADAPAGPPTAEQREQLRAEVRRRLLAARDAGPLQVQGVSPSGTAGRPVNTGAGNQGGNQPAGGNAVYRIEPTGFVSEVFRESVMVLNLAMVDDHLLVATGNEGQVFRVNPAKEETARLVNLDAAQVTLILPHEDGPRLATANPAQLLQLTRNRAATGHWISPALDAGQVSRWGALRLTGVIPPQTRITVSTRSGNVGDPELGGWSAWTDPVAFDHQADEGLQPRSLSVASPSARFLQYRVTLSTEDREASPTVNHVQTWYVQPNMRPVIAGIKTQYAGENNQGGGNKADAGPKPQPMLQIAWKASDPNGDSLQYKLEYRRNRNAPWLPIADELTQNRHVWDTRRVADGYYQLRVTASDAADNPGDHAAVARYITDPVLVDNRSPAFAGAPTVQRDGETATVELTATDEFSPLAWVHYAVDDGEWTPTLPEDFIWDSTRETVRFKIAGLSPGPHALSIRVTDRQGNVYHQAITLEAAGD